MPKFTLNDEGQLVNTEGEAFEIEGEAVTVDGVKTQADIDKTVNERLARETKNNQKLKEAAAEVPGLKEMVEESNHRIAELTRESEDIAKQATSDIQAQVSKSNQAAEVWKQKSQASDQKLEVYKSQHELLAAAGDTFVNAMQDVIPLLSRDRKADPVIGEDGKATGETKNIYRCTYKNEEGESVDGYLPADKAIAAIAEANLHLVKPTGASGSGGGDQYTVNPNTNLKRSEMSTGQKVAYANAHGDDAFRALPA